MDSCNLDDLNNIDQKRQMTVSGYVHELETIHNQNIPKEIIFGADHVRSEDGFFVSNPTNFGCFGCKV